MHDTQLLDAQLDYHAAVDRLLKAARDVERERERVLLLARDRYLVDRPRVSQQRQQQEARS